MITPSVFPSDTLRLIGKRTPVVFVGSLREKMPICAPAKSRRKIVETAIRIIISLLIGKGSERVIFFTQFFHSHKGKSSKSIIF
jgi:hypothetical protein